MREAATPNSVILKVVTCHLEFLPMLIITASILVLVSEIHSAHSALPTPQSLYTPCPSE